MNPIQSHFDQASAQYAKASANGIWKFMRNSESRNIVKMLPKINDATTALDLGCGSGYYSDLLKQLGVKNQHR